MIFLANILVLFIIVINTTRLHDRVPLKIRLQLSIGEASLVFTMSHTPLKAGFI